MKKLIDMFFKKETELSYILPKYQPAPINLVETQVSNADYYIDEASNTQDLDDMQIDKIYRCS